MNLGELKITLDRYLKRTDLQDLYDTWIGFTSSRIDMQLRLSEQEYRSINVPTEQYILLPPDFIEMRHIETSADGGRPLKYVPPAQIDTRNIALAGAGRVQFYTIINNQLELIPAPAADSVATLEMFYYAKLPPMSQDDQSNKVLLAYPQLYVYGCMIEASAFREHQADQTTYATLWRDYAKVLNDKQDAARFSGDSIQMRAV